MPCTYPGNPSLYGLGLRTAFYLLWSGTLIAGWITRPEVPTLRFVHTLFIAAALLSITILASWNSVFPIDVYITVLLAYGSFYALVPYYLWRAVTVCNPFTDMGRWPRVRSTAVMRVVGLLLVVAGACFQIWFWSTGLHSLPRERDCQTWGFFFSRAKLDAPVFVAANMVFIILILLGATMALMAELGMMGLPWWMAKREKSFRKMVKRAEQRGEEYSWKRELQFAQGVSDLAVFSVLVIAIELTVQWNDLTAVNDLAEPAQMIPMVLAAGLFAHIGYVWVNPYHNIEILEDLAEDLPEPSTSSSGSRSRRNRSRGSGPDIAVVVGP
ncbi:hypothetical protein QBC34DRAFT_337013 [Podospora aff. communis PSN243]|uniref:Uncharacterized protein n=1 Tax=Podospora aff. communis PSN243 TaxID=3040156 RepID=A0AAV9G7H4_9PEZI|nr:hypothetical protein QBC34DRAFT_337013 [Podospora aff. communis PSN243]